MMAPVAVHSSENQSNDSRPPPADRMTPGKYLQMNFLQTEDSSAVSIEHTKDTKRIYLGTYKRWIWGSILALCFLAPVAVFIRSHYPAVGQPKAGKPLSQTLGDFRQHSAFISSPRAGSLVATPPKSPVAMNAYVPDGLSKEEWAKIQNKEKYKGQNLGSSGPKGYKSRSFNDFVSQLEKGDPNAKNLPMFFAKERLARGEITKADIPYMQRGGSYDGSDLKEEGPLGFLYKAFKKKEVVEKSEDFSKLSQQEYNKRVYGASDKAINNAPKLDGFNNGGAAKGGFKIFR